MRGAPGRCARAIRSRVVQTQTKKQKKKTGGVIGHRQHDSSAAIRSRLHPLHSTGSLAHQAIQAASRHPHRQRSQTRQNRPLQSIVPSGHLHIKQFLPSGTCPPWNLHHDLLIIQSEKRVLFHHRMKIYKNLFSSTKRLFQSVSPSEVFLS